MKLCVNKQTSVTSEEWRSEFKAKDFAISPKRSFSEELHSDVDFDINEIQSSFSMKHMAYESTMSTIRDGTLKNAEFAMSKFVDYWFWCQEHIVDWKTCFPTPHTPQTGEVMQVFIIWCYIFRKYSISTLRNTFKTGLSFYFNYRGWLTEKWIHWTALMSTTATALLMKFGHVEFKV